MPSCISDSMAITAIFVIINGNLKFGKASTGVVHSLSLELRKASCCLGPQRKSWYFLVRVVKRFGNSAKLDTNLL